MIQDDKLPLKEKFLEYYRQLPIQRLAAASIGRHEDTVIIWKNEDSDFSDQQRIAKAEWTLKNVKSVRSKEWLLERITRDEFKPPQLRTDITSGGKPIPILGGISNAIPENNSNNETSEVK